MDTDVLELDISPQTSSTARPTTQGSSDAKPPKEFKHLRNFLRRYLSEPFKWKDYTCTFSILYIVIFAVQVAKLFFISSQMFSYGEYNSVFGTAVHLGHLTLRHLLLENWDAGWETVPYPPARGDFAVYTINDFERGVNFAVSRYYNADSDAAAFFKRLKNDDMEVMINYFEFKDGILGKEIIKSEKRFAIDHGLTKETKDNKTEYSYSIAKELKNLNISEAMQQIYNTTLEFTLHSVRLHDNDQVLCLHIAGKVHFNDMNYNGQIEVNLATNTHSIPCESMNLSVKDFDSENQNKWENYAIGSCFTSAILTGLMIVAGFVAIFWTHKSLKELPCSEYTPIICTMIWDMIQFSSDACNIKGTYKLKDSEGDELNRSSLDKDVVLLGVGCILAWFSVIRYLKINKSFSLLFETMYRAKWNVMAYLICVTVLFTGFLFCGYVVMGPYHIKFRTLNATTETLFALIQGDEIYATFAMFQDEWSGNVSVLYFARFYLVLYICIFTIVAINLLIALFNSAYETIQNRHDKKRGGQIEMAIEKVIKQEQNTDLKTSLRNLLNGNQCSTNEETCLKEKLLQVSDLDFISTERIVTSYKTLQSFLDDLEKEDCVCWKSCWLLSLEIL